MNRIAKRYWHLRGVAWRLVRVRGFGPATARGKLRLCVFPGSRFRLATSNGRAVTALWPRQDMLQRCGICEGWAPCLSHGLCLTCVRFIERSPGGLNRYLSHRASGLCAFGCDVPATFMGLCAPCARDHYA